MAGEKVSSKTETDVTSGAYYYTIIPGLLGLFLPRKISWAKLFAPVTSRLSDLESAQGGFSTQKYTNRSAAFTHSLTANSKLESIDARLTTGSPVIKVGTTVGGMEVMESTELTAGTDLNNPVFRSFPSATTIYITISGGAANITLIIRNEIL